MTALCLSSCDEPGSSSLSSVPTINATVGTRFSACPRPSASACVTTLDRTSNSSEPNTHFSACVGSTPSPLYIIPFYAPAPLRVHILRLHSTSYHRTPASQRVPMHNTLWHPSTPASLCAPQLSLHPSPWHLTPASLHAPCHQILQQLKTNHYHQKYHLVPSHIALDHLMIMISGIYFWHIYKIIRSIYMNFVLTCIMRAHIPTQAPGGTWIVILYVRKSTHRSFQVHFTNFSTTAYSGGCLIIKIFYQLV